MKGKTIVTNIRVNENDWNQVRAVAGEMGMSVNQYVNFVLRSWSAQKTFGWPEKPTTTKKKITIWDLPKLAKLAKPMKGGLSEDDKIIYGG